MNKLLLGLILIASAASSSAADIRYKTDDLQGTYSISGVDIAYRAEIKLSTSMGAPLVEFTEKMGSDFECKGFYSVEYGTIVNLTMYCGDITHEEAYIKMMRDEKADFTQEIDLKGISKDQVKSSFIANVKSSLYNNIPYKFQFTRE